MGPIGKTVSSRFHIAETYRLVCRKVHDEFGVVLIPKSALGIPVSINCGISVTIYGSSDKRAKRRGPRCRSGREKGDIAHSYSICSGLGNGNEPFSVMRKHVGGVICWGRPVKIQRSDVNERVNCMRMGTSSSTLIKGNSDVRRLRRARRKGRNRSGKGVYRRIQIRNRRRNRIRPGIEIEHVGNDGVPSGRSKRVARLNVGHGGVPYGQTDGDRAKGCRKTHGEERPVLQGVENGRGL